MIVDKYSSKAESLAKLTENIRWSFQHVKSLDSKLVRYSPAQISDNTLETLSETYDLSPEELYDVGATALDSSIMLTFQNITSCHKEQRDLGNGYVLPSLIYFSFIILISPTPFYYRQSHHIKFGNNRFLFEAAVFDLDPKLYPNHFLKYKNRSIASYEKFKSFIARK